MRTSRWITMRSSALLALLAGWPCVSHGQPNGSGPGPASVARLGWLTGCWISGGPRTLVEEQWTSPSGGSLLGLSRTLRGDGNGMRLASFEFLRIFERGERVVYAAQPQGGPPTEFVAVTTSDSAVAFENPEHDFPKRITYRRVEQDSLHARIDDGRDGSENGVTFRYARVQCDRPAVSRKFSGIASPP